MSKRTQIRNEKALQDLVRSVPGNDRCADCAARNPGWASWSNMRRNGNAASNKIYNPRNSKPAIPLDVDEVDSAIERFIRQKYDQQTFSGGDAVRPTRRHDTGSTRSSDDQPPPLPPKPGKRFGFGLRSVSSALPMGKNSHVSPPTSPDTANGYPPSPPIRVNKQSRVFGASVGGGGDNIEAKLITLRDMGFGDEKRNATILKGLNGNLERSIETLVRLGDGNTTTSRPRSPAKPRQVAVSQPVGLSQPFSSVGVEPPMVAPDANADHQVSSGGAQGQISPVRGFVPNERMETPPAPSHSYNPFDTQTSRSDTWPLDKAFENLQVSQPQPLFPNATGGYPIQPQHVDANRLQQSMTPPVPQLHQHLLSNPYAHQMLDTMNNYNPFFQPLPQVPPIPSGFYTHSAQPQPSPSKNAYNPFIVSQPNTQPLINDNILQSPQGSAPQHSPQHAPPQAYQQTPQQMPQQQPQQPQQPQMFTTQQTQPLPYHSQPQMNPFLQPQPPNPQPPIQYPQPQPQQNPYAPQPLQHQQTGHFDKSSILALYNYPHLAPPPLPTNTPGSENFAPSPSDPPSSTSSPRPPGRSVTMPISGTRNPFHTAATNNNAAVAANAVPAHLPPSGLSRHVSQESVDVGGWQSGRHSPDAFASLSARFVR
ncbi:MAG: hypothetical protein Q9174_005628 [Haloplaca sp. 1 TL-2023]